MNALDARERNSPKRNASGSRWKLVALAWRLCRSSSTPHPLADSDIGDPRLLRERAARRGSIKVAIFFMCGNGTDDVALIASSFSPLPRPDPRSAAAPPDARYSMPPARTKARCCDQELRLDLSLINSMDRKSRLVHTSSAPAMPSAMPCRCTGTHHARRLEHPAAGVNLRRGGPPRSPPAHRSDREQRQNIPPQARAANRDLRDRFASASPQPPRIRRRRRHRRHPLPDEPQDVPPPELEVLLGVRPK